MIYTDCISGDALREALKLDWRSNVSKIRSIYRLNQFVILGK